MRCTLLDLRLAMLSPDLNPQARDEMVSAARPSSGWEQALTTISIAGESRGATIIRNRELVAAPAHSKISGPVAARPGTLHLHARHSALRALQERMRRNADHSTDRKRPTQTHMEPRAHAVLPRHVGAWRNSSDACDRPARDSGRIWPHRAIANQDVADAAGHTE